MKDSQKRAISYAVTKRNQNRALQELDEIGVDYYAYCERFVYSGSPVRLLNDIQRGSRKTLQNLAILEEEYE